MFSFNDKKDPLINMAVSGAISGAIGLGVGLGIIALAPVIGVSVGGALGIGAVCLTTTVIGAGIGVGIGFALSDKNQDGTPHDSSSVVDGDRSQKTHTNFVEQSNGANTVAVTKGQQTSILPARIKEEPNASAVIQPENEQAQTEKTKDLTAKFKDLGSNDFPLLVLALRHNAMTCVLNKQVNDDAKIKDLKAINETKTQIDILAHLAPYINDVPSVKGFEGYLGTAPTTPLTKHFQKRFHNALETTQDSTPKLDSIKEIMDEVYGLIINPNTIQKKLNAIQNASNLTTQPISNEGHAATNTSAHTLGNTLPSSSSAPAQGATNGGGGKGVAGSDSPQALQQTPQAQSAALEISARGEPIRSTNDGTLLSPQKYSAANKPLGPENSPTLQSSSPPSPSPAQPTTNTMANNASTQALSSAPGH